MLKEKFIFFIFISNNQAQRNIRVTRLLTKTWLGVLSKKKRLSLTGVCIVKLLDPRTLIVISVGTWEGGTQSALSSSPPSIHPSMEAELGTALYL